MTRLHLHIHPPADGKRSRPGSLGDFYLPHGEGGRLFRRSGGRVLPQCRQHVHGSLSLNTTRVHTSHSTAKWAEAVECAPSTNALTWDRGSCCFRTTCRVPVACWPAHVNTQNTRTVSYTCKRPSEDMRCTCAWTKVSGPHCRRLQTESWSRFALGTQSTALLINRQLIDLIDRLEIHLIGSVFFFKTYIPHSKMYKEHIIQLLNVYGPSYPFWH